MSERINSLSKWTPGPRSAGALFEMNGYSMPKANNAGIDGGTALSVWKKGKCTAEVASAVATACSDSEALRTMMKDRRVGVRQSVLSNPSCPWDLLVSLVSWSKGNESWSVRRTARTTMERKVMRSTFSDAISWLGEGQPREAYAEVAQHSRATDDELTEFAKLSWTDSSGELWHAHHAVANRSDLYKRSDDFLFNLAVQYPGSMRYVVGAAVSAKGRRDLMVRLMDLIATRDEFRAALRFCSAVEVGAEFHAALYEWLKKHTGDRAHCVEDHMCNPEAPWQLWEHAKVSNRGACDVIGRGIAEKWGDDAAVWELAGSLLNDFDGTVSDFISTLEIFHPLHSA